MLHFIVQASCESTAKFGESIPFGNQCGLVVPIWVGTSVRYQESLCGRLFRTLLEQVDGIGKVPDHQAGTRRLLQPEPRS